MMREIGRGNVNIVRNKNGEGILPSLKKLERPSRIATYRKTFSFPRRPCANPRKIERLFTSRYDFSLTLFCRVPRPTHSYGLQP